MKHLYKIFLFFIASVVFLQSWGQPPVKQSRSNKPLLFAHLNDPVEIPVSLIQHFFSLNATDTFLFQTMDFRISGIVMEKRISPADSAVSINLRLLNFKNALFNIVYIRNNDNVPAIRGRIIHPKYGDVLVLEPENGRYYLRKQEQRLLLTE